ncbi:uncharacterized protein LOC118741118 [Rhagoletis pomonella]|uniref:uncharacterized protein LOC118741118 n=1 Tax=Rhagoletis pomonella TaxID=28610 RepID=UPI001784FB0F|nr:uncharacterized protein LOC118741118 [Rhagoletis pomonella]XP_036328848.1 uncharacterized protein LOC118741118 [Rhagoletis pomonella]
MYKSKMSDPSKKKSIYKSNTDFQGVRFACGSLEPKIDNLETELKVLQDQLKYVLEVLAQQTVLLKNMTRQHINDQTVADKFPITSEEQLLKINDEITSENKLAYIRIRYNFNNN